MYQPYLMGSDKVLGDSGYKSESYDGTRNSHKGRASASHEGVRNIKAEQR